MTKDKSIASDEGSVVADNQADPNLLGGKSGESITNPPENPEMVPKLQYNELEKKLGENSDELGNLRKSDTKYKEWFEETTPLLEKLESNPELVKAILADKIDPKLVESVMTGKVSQEEAEKVTETHKEVKKELGDKATPKEISEAVDKKLSEAMSGIEEKVNKRLTEAEIQRVYNEKIKEFVANTKDFAEYAEDVDKFFKANPKIDDISVAYNAVKGVRLQKEKEKSIETEQAEAAKGLAANAGGGASQQTGIRKDPDLAEQLIGGPGSPNTF